MSHGLLGGCRQPAIPVDGRYPDGPIGGAALTVLLALLSGLTSAVLGLGLGIALAVLRGWPRWVLVTVLGFFRAIPVLMLIFWSYFLLPIVFKVDVPALATVVCALSLIGGAYLAHSVYAGIHSLPAGQWAAAKALGLRPWQVLRLVILPQALPIMLPSFLNQWISLIKDTSLAYVIGVGELSFVATQVSNRVMVHPTEIYLFVALLYFLFCYTLDLIDACQRRVTPWLIEIQNALSRRPLTQHPQPLPQEALLLDFAIDFRLLRNPPSQAVITVVPVLSSLPLTVVSARTNRFSQS